jgi:2-C-methyl-D-erythritol 4-phosphate cytidylyltransferase
VDISLAIILVCREFGVHQLHGAEYSIRITYPEDKKLYDFL